MSWTVGAAIINREYTVRTLFVIITFARQDLIEKYSGSILGSLWSLLMPLVNILIFTIVFSKIMGARLAMAGLPQSEFNYSLYLVSGLLAWNCFAACVTRTTNLYQEKAGIITKVNISLRVLPLYVILSETIIYLISMVFFVIFALLVDHQFHWTMMLLPVIFILQQIVAYSLGLLFATFSVFIRDIRELVTIVFHVWFWFTPIVYAIAILPESGMNLMNYNPAFHVVNAYRQVFLLGEVPPLTLFLYMTAAAAALLAFAVYVNRHLQSDIRDFI
jgi:lipopolysaccharide transport system permease protein